MAFLWQRNQEDWDGFYMMMRLGRQLRRRISWKIPIGRPRKRRKDSIKIDINKTGYEEGAHGTAQDRVQ
jgi:hypothetical protein